MIIQLLNRQNFENWLMSFDSSVEPIGDINAGDSCPMRLFLQKRIEEEGLEGEVKDLSLAMSYLTYYDKEENYIVEYLPDWAYLFYKKLEHKIGFVTPRQCFWALEEISNVN